MQFTIGSIYALYNSLVCALHILSIELKYQQQYDLEDSADIEAILWLIDNLAGARTAKIQDLASHRYRKDD